MSSLSGSTMHDYDLPGVRGGGAVTSARHGERHEHDRTPTAGSRGKSS